MTGHKPTESTYWIAVRTGPTLAPHVFGPFARDRAHARRADLAWDYDGIGKISPVIEAAERDTAEQAALAYLAGIPEG